MFRNFMWSVTSDIDKTFTGCTKALCIQDAADHVTRHYELAENQTLMITDEAFGTTKVYEIIRKTQAVERVKHVRATRKI